jgi:hypothetical protein
MALVNPGQAFLDAIISTNPLLGPIKTAFDVGVGVNKKYQELQAKPQAKAQAQPPTSAANEGPPPPPPEAWEAGLPSLPVQQGMPQGSANAGGLAAVLQEYLRQQAEATNRTLDPNWRRETSQIDVDVYGQQTEIAKQAALEKMREKTARDIELQNIQSWQAITQAQINRDTELARSMMNVAYIAGTPNANVLSALTGPTQAAINAYEPGKPVF